MAIPDPRLLAAGCPIPSEGYIDQPFMVRTDDGAWLCAMTTGAGAEGEPGQHVVTLRSTDHGATWTDRAEVEPLDGPEASYSVLLKVPSGRIYCFYNHNTDRVTEVRTETGGSCARVDSLGHYVFKYSDDHGRSWSAQRYEVPVRAFAIDRENVYGGSLRFFWNVGRPLVLPDAVLLVLHKVGAFGTGFFARSEGAFLCSANILTETDPAQITFDTLPDGDVGLRAPKGGGRIAEEQSVTVLSDGSLYCVYRTIDGWPACAYSRDGGHTWSAPDYAAYTPGGRRLKHPRAANFVWRCQNGMFLYWFHNHGGAFIQANNDWLPYEDRNPAWVVAGREVETPAGRMIEWSQPEILLYDDDTYIRMSYPDLVEEDGRCWITETQKSIGHVHEIAPALLDGLFNQWTTADISPEGLLLDLAGEFPATIAMPALPAFTARDYSRSDHGQADLRTGFSLDLWLDGGTESMLLDSRTPAGMGLCLAVHDGALEIILHDGRTENHWRSDPSLLPPGWHHAVVTVDGGPKIITFVLDGVLCDGGEARQFGWGRFSPHLRHVNGEATAHLGPLHALRIYGRPLRTSEAVAHWRAGDGGR